jgi:RHS repeat-associated protein
MRTSNELSGGLGVDEHFLRSDSTGHQSYLTDGVNSTLALTDLRADVMTLYSFDPFGRTTSSGGSNSSLQYTGRENDATGLYYYRAPYYSPTLQRFISQDPLGFNASTEVMLTFTLMPQITQSVLRIPPA